MIYLVSMRFLLTNYPLSFRSVFIDPPQLVENIPPVRITFPDGTHILSDHEGIDYTLSKVLGQDVRLMTAQFDKPSYEEYWPDIDGLAQREKVTDENMPSRTFFDIAVIHLLTTSTIDRLRELYPEGRFEIRLFRPNIVLRVTGPCTRCVMTTLLQRDLPKDLGILRTMASYNQVTAGIYASVHQHGTIRRGDVLLVEV